MATNKVSIGIDVSDNGSTVNLIKKVKNLKDLLTQTASIASSISVGGLPGGGRGQGMGGTGGTGSAGGGRPRSGPAASGGAAGPANPGGSGTYGQARATMGTGAEARDFAKQSEGLGGLVRLYATYAANIYAAGAAFRALSEAASTANIVQGLNQLGAASGVALGTLSKQFAQASGGAISFREAMQATAQATSAGLTSKQFLQLGEVAKKASQALGVNMSDAVSRLTRGITKLEPELIDELGLFTKIGPATENYAKSIGKTVSSLTDFERRQAFANAVLTEGLDKFSGIDIPTNPYDKLSASLANLSYESLSVVNKALLPLVDALSKSPGTLLAIVTSLAVVMAKQAIPALTQYRAGMEANALAAQAHANETNTIIAGLRAQGAALTTHEVVMQRVANSATKTAASYTILSNAIENTNVSGVTDAFRILRAELALNTAGFGFFARAALMARGAVAILTTGLSLLVSAFSGPLIAITLLVTGYQLLTEYLSDNSKEVEKYNEAIKAQDEYTKALTATTEKYSSVLTVQSIIAKATAFGNLADGVIATAEALQAAEAKSGWLDDITNYVKGKFGSDLRSVFAETTTSSIIQGLQSIDDAEIRKQAEESIKNALGIDNLENLTADIIKNALKTANLGKLRAAQEANKNRVTAATGPLQGLADGFKEVNKDFQDLSNSLVNNDPLSRFGASLIRQTELLANAFSKPTTALATLNSIMKDTSQIKAFPPESQKAIIEVARQYKEVSDNIALYKSRIDQASKIQKEAGQNEVIAKRLPLSSKLRDDATEFAFLGGSNRSERNQLMRQSAVAQESQSRLGLARDEKILKELQDKLAKALATATETGFKLIEGPLTRAISQAGIETQKTLLSYLPKTPEAVGMAADLEIQSIELKKEELIETRRLTDAITLSRLSEERRDLEKDLKETSFTSVAGQDIVKKMAENTARRQAVLDPSKIDKSRASGVVAGIYQQNVGYQAKLVELESQQNQIRIKKAVDVAISDIDNLVSKSQDKLDDLAKSNVNYFKSAAFTRMSDIAQLDEKTKRAKEEQEQSDAIARDKASKDTRRAEVVAKLATTPGVIDEAKKAAEYAKDREIALKNQQDATRELADLGYKDARTQIFITKSLDDRLSLLEDNSKLADIQSQRDSQELDSAAQKLDFDMSLGKLSKDQYQTQKRINDLKNLELETTNQLRKVTETYNKEQLEIEKKLADKVVAPEGSDKQLELINERVASKELYESGVQGIKAAAALKSEGIILLSSINERTQVYGDAFKSTVDSMSDALVDFAMTGKASFGDLIESMITDLIKFEQRKALSTVFESFGGVSGLINMGLSALSGSAMTQSGFMSPGAVQPGGYSGPVYVNKALGGAYNQGREVFAIGGAFTITIVSRPTTFAFAKGAGLMGESGPEAIMPLKRGPNGSLGIQGGNGGNVDVVVNNYGQEKAQTKESTDARGNRRIEVIIGEMTAAEMNRPNSPVQASMKSTFGIAPSLTRR
jgi:hypothetical protein